MLNRIIKNLGLLMCCSVMLITPAVTANAAVEEKTAGGTPSVKVHFLTLRGADTDAIVLEATDADGTKHFGMVDAADDTNVPPGGASTPGYEDEVNEYLTKLNVNHDNFEFFIGTHAHSDHIGGADEVIRAFHPQKVYIKPYSDDNVLSANRKWDNAYVYADTIKAAQDTNAKLITKLTPVDNGEFKLGESADIELFNFDYDPNEKFYDINSASIITKMSVFGRKVLLTGDMNTYTTSNVEDDVYGLESALIRMNLVKDIDIYKLAHHGIAGSNSKAMLDEANPKYIVQTGYLGNIPNATMAQINQKVGSKFYSTSSYYNLLSAIVFTINTDGSIETNIPKFTPGFVTTPRGTQYADSNGALIYNQWILTGNKWYYFGANGLMQRGWVYFENRWYYLNADGTMKTGWLLDSGRWYYLYEDGNTDRAPVGSMKTGWLLNGNRWYYLNEEGNTDGAPVGSMKTSWLLWKGKWYYLNPEGNADGAPVGSMKTGWLSYYGNWYYLLSNGEMVTGTVTIDGKRYTFNSDGKLIS